MEERVMGGTQNPLDGQSGEWGTQLLQCGRSVCEVAGIPKIEWDRRVEHREFERGVEERKEPQVCVMRSAYRSNEVCNPLNYHILLKCGALRF